MKNKTKIWLTTIGSLIIPTSVFSVMTMFFFIRDDKTHFYTEPLSYKNNNKEIGFNHVEFEQHQIYNPKTKKHEYYLDEYGKKYLIKRFMESSIIGPEISSLKKIVISDYAIIKNKNVGKYYPIANSIYINPNSYLKNIENNLWNEQDEKEMQEKRVEFILPTLSHEYGHHLFTSYASSPIGHSKTDSESNLANNVKFIKMNKKLKSVWNKIFYNDFKRVFFDNGIVSQNEFKNNWDRVNEYYELKNKESVSFIEQAHIAKKIKNIVFNYYISKNKDSNSKWRLFFNYYKDVTKIFQMANENLNILKYKDKDFLIGIKLKDLDVPQMYKTNYKNLKYIYSMSEQVTRKLLLATYPLPKESYKLSSNAFTDNLYSNIYVELLLESHNNWYRFYTDNVFLSKFQEANSLITHARNNSKEFIENIISSLIGHKNHSNISFITTQNSWNILTINKAIKKTKTNDHNDHNDYKKIKFGGYINSNDYKYIGYYKSNKENGEEIKYEIDVKNFNIWYKNKLNSKIKQQTSTYKGKGKEYYWYLKKFIKAEDIINKKLYFFRYAKNGKIEKMELKSIRNNDYGIANSFNSGNIGDDDFVENIMVEPGKGKKWLIVANDVDAVKLKYYERQEEMEKLWS